MENYTYPDSGIVQDGDEIKMNSVWLPAGGFIGCEIKSDGMIKPGKVRRPIADPKS